MSIADIVKAHDRDRYIATLFAPEQKRHDLLTLYAFDAEVSRIRVVISDPLPGEIRLQWWREVINGARAGDASGNALASGIVDVIARNALPIAAFEAYFDAKIFEFYNDAFPDTESLEAWCGETSSAILQMATLILDKDTAKLCADACGHGGVALGITKIVAELAKTRGRGQCFLPCDLLSACGLEREGFVSGADKAKIKNATDALCEMGLVHYSKWQAAFLVIPKQVKPAFLPMANVRNVLVKATSKSCEPAHFAPELSSLKRLIGIIRLALR